MDSKTLNKFHDTASNLTEASFELYDIAKAMRALGLPVSERLFVIVEEMRACAKDVRDAAGETLHKQLVDSERATKNMVMAAIGVLTDKPEGRTND